jgi:hypothetical protein
MIDRTTQVHGTLRSRQSRAMHCSCTTHIILRSINSNRSSASLFACSHHAPPIYIPLVQGLLFLQAAQYESIENNLLEQCVPLFFSFLFEVM